MYLFILESVQIPLDYWDFFDFVADFPCSKSLIIVLSMTRAE